MGLSNNEKKSCKDSKKANESCGIDKKCVNKQFEKSNRNLLEEDTSVDILIPSKTETIRQTTERDSNANLLPDSLKCRIPNRPLEKTYSHYPTVTTNEGALWDCEALKKAVLQNALNGSPFRDAELETEKSKKHANCYPYSSNSDNNVPFQRNFQTCGAQVKPVQKDTYNSHLKNERLSVAVFHQFPTSLLKWDKSPNNNISPQVHIDEPLQWNHSIYKLAYDESLLDHSRSASRSPTPTDPESQMPCSLMNHEINVYEADSEDEAGSEDLELIPHRYESESFLNKSKHLYENKLSLAVELLRTKESLPYDAQFKRIPSHQQTNQTQAMLNMAFKNDSKTIEMKSKLSYPNDPIVKNELQVDLKQSSFQISPNCDHLTNEKQGNSNEVEAAYQRRIHHYFCPRSTLNPLNCCGIM